MRLELADFRAAPATHIVSLGSRCATTYNLRRHFDFSGAFPFDWWITELGGVETFLGSLDVEKLYDPTFLELTEGRGSVRHIEFGFFLHHEFPRHWNLPDIPVKENWRDLLEQPKQRTSALVSKLLRLNAPSNRIAFVREGATSTLLVERLDVLFPAADWTLTALSSVVTDETVHGWKGDPDAWDSALGSLGLTLDRTGHRNFVEQSSVPEVDTKLVSA